MTTFAVTSTDDIINAVNYAISNLGTAAANITGNVLTLNTSTNAITVGVGGTVYAYNVQYVNIRYANTATGSSGFTAFPTNSSYYGIQASANATPNTINNVTSYSWFQAGNAIGSGTGYNLYYQAPGGRQITFAVATSLPNSNFVQTVNNTAINLDVVTTAQQQPIVLALVYQRNTATPPTPTGGTYDFGNLILTPPSGWSNSIPAGTAAVYSSQNSFAGSSANAVVAPSGPWTSPVISLQNGANGSSGNNGTSTYTVTAYTSANTQPVTPTGGTWNFSTVSGTAPTATDGLTWTLYPANTITGNSLYICTAVASVSGTGNVANLGSTWSYPVNVGSSSGSQGTRGIFPLAYVLTPTDPTVANTTTLNSWFSANRANVTPPIGLSYGTTTYTPIPGDTVQFQNSSNANSVLYATYTGTSWANVTGQVINGNIIFPGTITANSLNVNSVYTLKLTGGTGNIGNTSSGGFWLDAVTGNAYFGGNLVVGNSASIGSNLVIGSNATVGNNLTVASNAIIGNNLTVLNNANIGNNLTIGSGITITGLTSSGNLIANTVGTTQLQPGSITTDKFTANTINGNIILAGTITANQLAANTLTANTVVSTGATLGNNSSQGFWLQGNTGNARFGNNLSIGNSLTVGTNANISANLRIGNSVIIGGSANIGNNATIGNNITIGNVVFIGNSLTVGANANIGNNLTVGNNLTIGANLQIGNNASIGGNLTVAGLITGSGTGAVLNANTVITTTLFPASVTSSAGVSYGDQYMSSNAAVANTVYTIGGPTIVTSVTNQQVIAWWQGGLEINFGVALGNSCQFNGTINLILCRYPTATPSSVTTLFTVGRSINVSGVTFPGASYSYYNVALPTYIDSLATPDSYTYAWGAYYTVISSSGTFTRTFKLTTLGNPNLNGGYAINSIVALGTKR